MGPARFTGDQRLIDKAKHRKVAKYKHYKQYKRALRDESGAGSGTQPQWHATAPASAAAADVSWQNDLHARHDAAAPAADATTEGFSPSASWLKMKNKKKIQTKMNKHNTLRRPKKIRRRRREEGKKDEDK